MDPEMTVRDFWQALASGDYQAAFYKLNDLDGWLARGGFVPSGAGMDADGWRAAIRNLRRALKAYGTSEG